MKTLDYGNGGGVCAINESQQIHPEILQGLKAVETEEVQEIIKMLAKYGLAVALPHSHGDNGNFLPIPDDYVVFESRL